MFSHHQDSRAPPLITSLGRQMSSFWTSSPSHCCFSPLVYTLSMMPYGQEYPLGQLGSGVPAVSIPSPCAAQPTHWWGWARGKKGFDCVSALLSNNRNILELPPLFWSQIQTTPNQLLWGKKTCPNPNQDILFLLKRELRACIRLINKAVNCQERC